MGEKNNTLVKACLWDNISKRVIFQMTILHIHTVSGLVITDVEYGCLIIYTAREIWNESGRDGGLRAIVIRRENPKSNNNGGEA